METLPQEKDQDDEGGGETRWVTRVQLLTVSKTKIITIQMLKPIGLT